MKLIIQIPCYNEEEYLPITFKELPRTIDGIDQIEYLVIDDGSADRTSEVARQLGVHHVVRHRVNRGLAAAFNTGITTALEMGADIIVNTDADNQYPGAAIADLVRPILEGQAEMVIGDRQIHQIAHFSPLKKFLQRLGSGVVRYVSGTDVPDAPSGFRALTREAALRLNILTRYSYTLETIIQAGKKNLDIAFVPVTVNADLRESRLVKSSLNYVFKSALTILRLFLLYEPLRTFSYISIPFLVVGGGLWLRFLIFMLMGQTVRGSNIQSVVVGSVAIIIAGLIFTIGLLGDIIAINRQLLEEQVYLLKKQQGTRRDD